MHLIRSLQNPNINKETCLTIGNFDGFHLGHQKILQKVKETAKHKNIASAVLSFEPHPNKFFKKEHNANFRINSIACKIKFIKEFGIDYAIIINFNQKFSQISANEFLRDIIIKKLKTKNIIIGHDFVFGKDRLGDINFLKKLESELDFEASSIDPIKINSRICSSSLIREYIMKAKIKEANELLGRNYAINSVVIKGKNMGHKIGFPTANMVAKPDSIKLKYGVYKTKTYLPHLNKNFDSITNFGIKPTVQSNNNELIETHIFNFQGNIYGKKISIEFTDFIREEKKFISIEDLQRQIKNDIKALYRLDTLNDITDSKLK